MQTSTLNHLNRLLRDHLGTTPAGGPRYKWFHSRDREMFCKIGRIDSDAARGGYEDVPLVWEVRWVLGEWIDPGSEAAWERQFQGLVPYPRGGYYMNCSIPSDPLLEMGVEPNERITYYTIQLRKKQLLMEEAEIAQSFADSRAQNKRNEEREVDAALTDVWTNCEVKVPGAREQLAEAAG